MVDESEGIIPDDDVFYFRIHTNQKERNEVPMLVTKETSRTLAKEVGHLPLFLEDKAEYQSDQERELGKILIGAFRTARSKIQGLSWTIALFGQAGVGKKHCLKRVCQRINAFLYQVHWIYFEIEMIFRLTLQRCTKRPARKF